MSRRGVVFGDVLRADKEWNERLGAVGEGQGLDLQQGPGVTSEIVGEAAVMLHADLFDAREGIKVCHDIVTAYTSATAGPLFEILVSIAGHALSTGVLTERQRWDDEPASAVKVVPTPAASVTAWLVAQNVGLALAELDENDEADRRPRELLLEALLLLGGGADD